MCKKLLSIIVLCLLSTMAMAQVVAYDLEDISQCNFEVFDLTAQIPPVLGDQDPETHSVTFYLSLSDAENATNPISNPEIFVGQMSQVIFVRVANLDTAQYAIAAFTASWNFSPWIPDLPDVASCDSYELPELIEGSYYSAPGGGGVQFMPGDIITISTTIYIFGISGNCTEEHSFEVTIGTENYNFAPLVACSPQNLGFAEFNLNLLTQQINFQLPNAEVSYYETMVDAMLQTNSLSTLYTNVMVNSQTIFAVITNAGCSSINPLQLVVQQCTNNLISGVVRYDSDSNGCTTIDGPAANIQITCTNGSTVSYAYTNNLGAYTLTNVQLGTNVLTVQGIPLGAISNPASQIVTVTGNNSNQTADFCIIGPTPISDVSVSIANISGVVPGFTTSYVISVFNHGNTLNSGTVTFTFDAAAMTYVSASALPINTTSNTVSFNYTVAPTNYQTFQVQLMVLPQPTVNSGSIITVTAIATSLQNDATPTDNSVEVNTIAVNSFDPNDISVVEGAFITPAQADGYLHYIIRFQNLGTAPARTIRIENELSAFLDWSTFIPLGASHPNYLTQRADSEVTFTFNDINLPPAEQNEAGSHGFVRYKVKPISTLAIGNVISNAASIYFDFNEAIVTNTVTTQIQQLSVSENTLSKIILYPNPASQQVQLSNIPDGVVHYSVYDVGGKQLMNLVCEGNCSIDVAALQPGLYMVKIEYGDQSVVKKLIVK